MPFKERSGRSPSGRLRNFGAMSPTKFLEVRGYVRSEANDPEALTAVDAEYHRRWGWGAPKEIGGRSDHQFTSKDPWDKFYDTVNGHSDSSAQDYYCARCGSWAGDHRADVPPMCPDSSGKGSGGYSTTDSFATRAWFDGHGVSTEPQPLSALLEELLS